MRKSHEASILSKILYTMNILEYTMVNYGFYYFIAGIVVIVASLFIGLERLMFFFYVGLVLVVIGVALLLIALINKPPKKAKPQKMPPDVRPCPGCKLVLPTHFKFCPRCGARLQ